MFVDDKVVKNFGEKERFDKFAIASTLVGVSFQGADCSILESKVIKNCDCITNEKYKENMLLQSRSYFFILD